MKTIKLLATSTIIALVLLQNCFAGEPSIRMYIQRVWMHLPNDYSVGYTTQDKVVHIERLSYGFQDTEIYGKWILENKFSQWSGCKVKQVIVADVPEGSPIYMDVTGEVGQVTVTIHIHSPAEIGSADFYYKSGKTTRQATTRSIE